MNGFWGDVVDFDFFGYELFGEWLSKRYDSFFCCCVIDYGICFMEGNGWCGVDDFVLILVLYFWIILDRYENDLWVVFFYMFYSIFCDGKYL